MKAIITGLFITAASALSAYQAYQIRTLQTDLKALAQIAKDQDEMIIAQSKHTEAVGDYATLEIHHVQDSIEERLGTAEHKIENLEFIFGEASKKQRKHK